MDVKELNLEAVGDEALPVLPESIGSLHQLTTLIVCNNQLTALPEAIGSLYELSALNASKNQLTELPGS
eukprot:4978043-Prymnesium_polylepis.1